MPDAPVVGEWDFIVVGAGAGGAPLAARLAQQGHRVLVLDAGSDAYPTTCAIPAFHPAASEDPAISWEFFVKHYSDAKLQATDSKFDQEKQGIFYPRAAGIGGCTIHNALITIAGPSPGWDKIAEKTGDPSWRGANMRQYFQRLEHCDYRPNHPADALHGYDGWLHTSWPDVLHVPLDPELIAIVVKAAKEAGLEGVEDLEDILKRGLLASLDPNDAETLRKSPEGVRLVPMAINHGSRSSPRDLLLATQKELQARGQGDRLTIQTDTLVSKILWERRALTPAGSNEPKAVGVEVLRGANLYRASVKPSTDAGVRETIRCKREVILCGGAFNTPQILMLSGIGPADQLKRLNIEVLLNRPGVGINLQDRNEVTVVTEMDRDFALLRNAAFGNPNVLDDEALDEWKSNRTGVYATNGVVLCIQKCSRKGLKEPDLFIFGVPGEFHGYQRGYSKQVAKNHDRFTWAILKAYTSNRGCVTLQSTDPRDRPDINFKYFNDATDIKNDDMNALMVGVKFVRRMNERAAVVVKQEVWPGQAVGSDDELRQFILRETWGHHACGTCKIGPAEDPEAVLDSRFRVRGVTGLRVVDASVFPEIPGMFIVSHIYMISEKAADVIGADAAGGPDNPVYPSALQVAEAEALIARRRVAGGDPHAADPLAKTVGLALSGGGVRSATFNLGILQALARPHLLRNIDYLSTVSGGGYIGSFLGRFYTRCGDHPAQASDRIEQDLVDPNSQAIDWLRIHANYLAPNGAGDATLNVGIYLRNLLTLHFVLGMLVLTFFGLANLTRFWFFPFIQSLLPDGFALPAPTDLPISFMVREGLGEFWSPWFMLFELMLLTMVLPLMAGYWLASQDEPETYQTSALIIVCLIAAVLLIAGLYGLGQVNLQPLYGVLSLVCAFAGVERAWRVVGRRMRGDEPDNKAVRLALPRSILTNWLATALFGAVVAFAFALVDTLAHTWYHWVRAGHPAAGLAQLMAVVAAFVPTLQVGASLLNNRQPADLQTASLMSKIKQAFLPWVIAVSALLVWLVLMMFVSHWSYDDGNQIKRGLAVTGFTLAVSVVLRWAIHIINRSSLAAYYAARLGRTYLGATNPKRHASDGAPAHQGRNVTEDAPGDDIDLFDYRPHLAGGPIHVINTTVNQTTDEFSRRDFRNRPGDVVAVTCFGISIGVAAHARRLSDQVLDPIPTHDGKPHPLPERTEKTEPLSLRDWIGISGAAISAARGVATNVGLALVLGLANLRTGYWWRSGGRVVRMPGRQREFIFLILLDLIPSFFLPQFLLVYELMGFYGGPWVPFWYLSDGGFFENLGVYELLRRRVRTIICCDAGLDPHFVLEDLGNLVRKARIDFHAEIRFLTRKEIDDHRKIPDVVKHRLGTLAELPPPKDSCFSKYHAALAYVYYDGSATPGSAMLYIKSSLTGDEPPDVMNYHAMHPAFPHDSTADQFFDESQWESYRALGESVGAKLLLRNANGRFWLEDVVAA